VSSGFLVVQKDKGERREAMGNGSWFMVDGLWVMGEGPGEIF